MAALGLDMRRHRRIVAIMRMRPIVPPTAPPMIAPRFWLDLVVASLTTPLLSVLGRAPFADDWVLVAGSVVADGANKRLSGDRASLALRIPLPDKEREYTAYTRTSIVACN